MPDMTLANHEQLHLSEFELDLECMIEGLDENDSNDANCLSLVVGSAIPNKARTGTLKLRYRALDPPEGVSQINDSALKNR